MTTKNKLVSFITPKGVAKWPRLDQPYSWSESAQRNVPDADGQYETMLLIPEKDAKPLLDLIKQAIDQSGIKPKNLPYKKEQDKETGEYTGNIEFKLKAYGKSKEGGPNKIKFFDSKGRMVPSTLYLTSGSTIRCLGWISVAKMGARLNLREVQVINLIERQAMGFDAVEGGFIYDGEDEPDNNKVETFEEANGSTDF